MSTRLGYNGLVTIYTPVYDANGRAENHGPTLANTLGRAVEWRLSVGDELADATALGDEFRRAKAGLITWDASLSLLWNAQNSTYNQDELFALFSPGSITARHAAQNRLGICLFTEGATAGSREAFYGVAVVEAADIVTAEADVVRLNVRLRGSDGIYFAASLFSAGAFGVLEQFTFAALEAYTFAQLETLAEP